MNYTVKFKCPECEREDLLDEVMDSVIMYSPIEVICALDDNSAACDYEVGQIRTEEGQVVRYQCCHCGFNPQDEQGNDICDPEDLLEWLEDRNMVIKGD